MKIFKYLRFLITVNIKTVYFNFKYLPFKQAVRLPILLSNQVNLKTTLGKIEIVYKIKTAMITIGFEKSSMLNNKRIRSIWEVEGTVIFKGHAYIGYGSKICVGKNGVLVLGENFTIIEKSEIISNLKIEFGNYCLLSWGVLVMDDDFHNIMDCNDRILNNPSPILIGDKVWIGCRSLVLKGATIPNGSVIGANSLVSKKLDDSNGLYVGSPAKLVKADIIWRV